MAKKKDETAEEAETNKSIGSQMTSKLTQRDRNLRVKAEMIERGERDEPTNPVGRTIRERNLILKAQLKKERGDENEKSEKAKGKTESESGTKSGTKKG